MVLLQGYPGMEPIHEMASTRSKRRSAKQWRWTAWVLAAALAAIPAPATGAAPCADVIVSMRTFAVSMRSASPAYRAGETASIEVTVTVPAREDPAGLGVQIDHPIAVPAAGVNVGVGMRLGSRYLSWGFRTADDGTGTVRAEIPRVGRPGPVAAYGFAWRTTMDGGCVIIEQIGYRVERSLFKIRR